MSSQLTVEQTALESPLERDKDFEVTVTFRVSAEAINLLVPRGVTARQFQEAFTTLLIAGAYTQVQKTRDLQKTERTETRDAGNNVIVPALRRSQELQQAGRFAQVALTHLETAALWADKAVVWTR